MAIDAKRLAAALDAIRQTGASPSEVIDAWEAAVDGGMQVFVSLAAKDLQSGDAYVTWLVTLAPNGAVLGLEHFSSTACGPHR